MLIMMTSIVAVSIHATSPLFGVGSGAEVAAAGAAGAVAAAGAGAAAGTGAACVAVGAAALSCASAGTARPAPIASTVHIEIDFSNRFIVVLPFKALPRLLRRCGCERLAAGRRRRSCR